MDSGLATCFVCLPGAGAKSLGLEGNIEDLDGPKELWLGRASQLHQPALQVNGTDPAPALAPLENVKGSVLGVVIFMHGSVGIAKPNLRLIRMLAGLGYLVLAPDSMATSKRRFRGLRSPPLEPGASTDYWSDNLVYTSGSEGELNYCSSVEKLLAEPESYRAIFEAVYLERSQDLRRVLEGLPPFARAGGVFLVGSSEGSAALTRFDERSCGVPVLGRCLTSACLEYCYFTPTEEAARFGGSLSVPTVNVIGARDPFFGAEGSVAQRLAADPGGCFRGSSAFTGNGYSAMEAQGLRPGLVCVLDSDKHDLTQTHDKLLRQLLGSFLAAPAACQERGAEWCAGAAAFTVDQSSEGLVLLREGPSGGGAAEDGA